MRTPLSRHRRLAAATNLPAIALADLRPLAPISASVSQTADSSAERPAPNAPQRGTNRPSAGRATLAPPPRVYRAATAQLAGLYPFLYGAGIPAVGPYLMTGAAFSCHSGRIARAVQPNRARSRRSEPTRSTRPSLG